MTAEAAWARRNAALFRGVMPDGIGSLLAEGWEDDKIAEHVGMSAEELLRLRQMTGAAKMLAGSEYSQSWGVIDGDISEDPAR